MNNDHPYFIVLIKATVTGFGVGYVPFAPGTVASLVAMLITALLGIIPAQTGWFDQDLLVPVLWLLSLASFVIGTIASRHYMRITGREDPSEIIIDEWCGMWLTYVLAASIYGGLLAWDEYQFLPVISLTLVLYFPLLFILFRLFDITKPWFVGWVDRHMKSALGVMLDDVAAALLSVLVFYLLFFIAFYSGLLHYLSPI